MICHKIGVTVCGYPMFYENFKFVPPPFTDLLNPFNEWGEKTSITHLNHDNY